MLIGRVSCISFEAWREERVHERKRERESWPSVDFCPLYVIQAEESTKDLEHKLIWKPWNVGGLLATARHVTNQQQLHHILMELAVPEGHRWMAGW